MLGILRLHIAIGVRIVEGQGNDAHFDSLDGLAAAIGNAATPITARAARPTAATESTAIAFRMERRIMFAAPSSATIRRFAARSNCIYYRRAARKPDRRSLISAAISTTGSRIRNANFK